MTPSFTYAVYPLSQSPGQALGLSVALSCSAIVLLLKYEMQSICALRIIGGHLTQLSNEERHVILRMIMRKDRLAISLLSDETIVDIEDMDLADTISDSGRPKQTPKEQVKDHDKKDSIQGATK